jgi:threonine synthase
VKYLSTRGGAPVGFEQALLMGLAPDGGLFVPEAWPRFSPGDLRAMRGQPYAQVALAVMSPFVGPAFPRAEFATMIGEAYATFAHSLVAPLVQIGPNDFLLELFHGPTLAFKDVALQLLARLYERVLQQGAGRLTILCATSGDTGSAAIEAIRGREAMDIFVLYPEGRVSDIQRRQMTTAVEANVHVLSVSGTFDDCQRVVKELFADPAFARETSLSGVNSINWARIMAQTVYYVTAALALGAPEREISFVVPSGNFGNVYAGYVARLMGLPIKRLIAATNDNDILVRALATGRYEKRGVKPTSSPSMDIEVASNFERLVFDALGCDAAETRALFASLAQSSAFTLPERARGEIAEIFAAERAGEDEVARAMTAMHEGAGRLIDPHTSVGAVALAKARSRGTLAASDCAVLLATAHPAKFPEAVERVTQVRPALPPHLADLMSRPERVARVPAEAKAVKSHILSARA